jgi:hypothetical protein
MLAQPNILGHRIKDSRRDCPWSIRNRASSKEGRRQDCPGRICLRPPASCHCGAGEREWMDRPASPAQHFPSRDVHGLSGIYHIVDKYKRPDGACTTTSNTSMTFSRPFSFLLPWSSARILSHEFPEHVTPLERHQSPLPFVLADTSFWTSSKWLL